MHGTFRKLMVLVLVSAARAQGAEVPDALRGWQDWVLHGEEFRTCPWLATRGSASQSAYRCAWPGVLSLDLNPRGGNFEQRWEVYTETWVVLPGSAEYWPREVRIDGNAAAVVMREGRPQLLLGRGTHQVVGRFAWTVRPEALPVSRTTAMVQLTLDGRAVSQPERPNGDVWLGQRRSAVERDRLDVTVYRLLTDDIPARLETQLHLYVSGAGREVLLGPVLPAGFVAMALEGDLPARMEPDGRLRVQLRPGQHEFSLQARGATVAGTITRPAAAEPWPADEVWSFQAIDRLRVAAVEDAESIDPSQSAVPSDWAEYPAFHLAAAGSLNVVERSRALVNQDDNQLSLDRELWLDFSHGGFTARDQVAGTLKRDWRLDMARPFTLESARIDERNLLVTESDNGSGVELRPRELDLSAVSRIEGSRARQPATGWSTRFDSVSGVVHLPPGHRLLGVLGADKVPASWVSRWGLWSLFGVLVLVVLTHWVAGRLAAIVAAIALILMYQEFPALIWLWANLLAAIALVRAVPEGRLRRYTLGYRLVSFLALALVLLPMLVGQLKLALYPSLAVNEARASDLYAARFASADEVVGEPVPLKMESPPPSAPAVSMPSPRGGAADAVDELGLQEVQVTGSRILSVTDRYAEGTLLQAGPGVPNWQYNTWQYGWSGPVEATQSVRFVYIGPALLGLWRIVGVLASLLLALLLARTSWGFALKLPGLRAAGSVAALMLLVGAPIPHARAQGLPTPEMLSELKTRLTEAPKCNPSCADIALAEVRADGGRLTIVLNVSVLAKVAVALPHAGDRWQLDSVEVDGRSAPFALREPDESLWLPLTPGAHRVQLSGRLANAETVQVNFPQLPRAISASASGWDVSGISNGHLLAGSLELIRRLRVGSAAAELAPSEFAPYVQVIRRFGLDLDWNISTQVQRLAPRAAPLQVEVPLVTGESVLSDDAEVLDGNRVVVGLARGEAQRGWRSRLERSDTIELTLPADAGRSEQWVFAVNPQWHVEFEGLPASLPQYDTYMWEWQFIPRAGETLTVHVTRPAPAAGRTLAIDSVQHTTTFGKRAMTGKLDLKYRSTQGGRQVIKLPEALRVTQVQVDGNAVPLRPDGGELPLSLLVGDHEVSVEWTAPRGAGLIARPDLIDLGMPASNVSTSISLPEDRWSLVMLGQGAGTVVLYWGELAIFALVALLLSLWSRSPLPFRDWLLLGLGLSTLSWPVFAVVALWLLVMRWRQDWQHDSLVYWRFDIAQCVLAAVTVIAVTSLVFSGVRYGLLAHPDMGVSGPVPDDGAFGWFLDRTDGALPRPTVLSVPIWVFRLLMFVWAAWVALALRRWLRAAWQAWTAGGFWRGKVVVVKQ